jgi:hypothetical protein
MLKPKLKRKKVKTSRLSKVNAKLSGLFGKLNLFKKRPVEIENEMKVPKEWLKKSRPLQDQEYVVVEKAKQKRKYKLGFLRTLKRVIAVGLAVFNFVIGQASLAGAAQTQILWVFFMANAYICIDYVWKTRHEPEPFEAKKK